MRLAIISLVPLMIISIVISLCGPATAQSDQIYVGVYAEPFSPRIATPVASPEALATPSLTLNTPSLTVGASNATLKSWTGTSVHFNQEPGIQAILPLEVFSAEPAQPEKTSAAASGAARPFEMGAAIFQSSYGVAELESAVPRRKAARTYTNPDVARLNDTNGIITYGGKTERLN
ncbi:MAG: hypothetical protein ACRD20_13420 [Terriglobales bacterium]